MNRMLKLCGAAGAAVLLSLGSPLAQAQNGITPTEILICAYQPMTGNEASYFRMGKGADAWFKFSTTAAASTAARSISS